MRAGNRTFHLQQNLQYLQYFSNWLGLFGAFSGRSGFGAKPRNPCNNWISLENTKPGDFSPGLCNWLGYYYAKISERSIPKGPGVLAVCHLQPNLQPISNYWTFLFYIFPKSRRKNGPETERFSEDISLVFLFRNVEKPAQGVRTGFSIRSIFMLAQEIHLA